MGIIREARLPVPDVGSILSLTEKISMNIIPSQKLGIETPNSDPVIHK